MSYYQGKTRVRVYGDINKFKTLKERRSEIDRIISSLEEIEPGWQGELAKTVWARLEEKKQFLRLKTWQTYLSKCRKFELFLKTSGLLQADINDFTEAHARQFLSKQKNPTTYNHYLQMFRGIWEGFAKEGKVTGNLWSNIQPQRQNPVPALFFQERQVKHLHKEIEARDGQLWLFCLFIFYTFIRPGELRLLKVGDIHFEENRVLIRSSISKNKKQQYVAIPEAFQKYLRKSEVYTYPPGYYVFSPGCVPAPDPVGKNWMKIRHQRILRELGYDTKQYKLYSWKHTGAVMAVRAGVPIKILQIQLRHHSLDQVEKYLRQMGINEVENYSDRFPDI
ncbi:MAG: site-specific integrase [Bacteroidia bacterium]|nr:site-specific integrase [Bacteroidia bacterium]